jgi:hypothetical protein
MKNKKSFDSVLIGLIPGILLPMGTLIIFWAVRYESSLAHFLKNFQQFGLLSKALSLATIPNLLLFFVFIWTNRSFSARGVIFATLVMAFVMLVLKIT